MRLRPEHKDHVWSYDFVSGRTHDGGPFRMLTVIDEYTRECLAIDVARKLTSDDVLERLAWLFATRGVPEHIRSDNGPEFTAKAVREWLEKVGVKTLFIEPGSPWENGYVESFNGKLRDELLDREIFDTLLEAKVLIERWREHYNTVRPHSSLGYRPPAPEAIAAGPPSAPLRADPQREERGSTLTEVGMIRGGRSITIPAARRSRTRGRRLGYFRSASVGVWLGGLGRGDAALGPAVPRSGTLRRRLSNRVGSYPATKASNETNPA